MTFGGKLKAERFRSACQEKHRKFREMDKIIISDGFNLPKLASGLEDLNLHSHQIDTHRARGFQISIHPLGSNRQKSSFL